jgi:aminoglycoside phosphotransferase (APT) family kinase protein
MREITSTTAAGYLRDCGRIAPGERAEVVELAGGVSNIVLLVALPERRERFVVKQARERLRVSEEWLCPVERIWREVQTLRLCGELLGEVVSAAGIHAVVPAVLWEDRANYAYAMTAAPAGHQPWKERLLAGRVDGDLATAAGWLLGRLHARSWNAPQMAAEFEDRSFFDSLRIDPYYRHLARRDGELAPHIERLIESVWSHRRSLVHGDFSPKNLLAWPGHLMLIDFEVGHYGDPAFDLGFFLTHLVLKGVWAGGRGEEYRRLAGEFWRAYRTELANGVVASELADLEGRMLWNLAGCLLARVDGKSRVDYLSPAQQQRVRMLARDWLIDPPGTWEIAVTGLNGAAG